MHFVDDIHLNRNYSGLGKESGNSSTEVKS